MRTRGSLALPLLAALTLVSAAACGGAGGPGGVAGSGNARTEDRPVQGFTKIDMAGFGTLTVTVSGTESLKVEADDNVLPLLVTEVRGDTLVLEVKPNASIQSAKVNYTITAKQLEGMRVSGAGEVKVVELATASFDVDISGSGQVNTAGRADSSKIEISGSGNYDGSATTSKTASVQVSGSGTAIVRVSDTLAAGVSGAGTVDYIGNPRVTEEVSGAGSVRKRG